MSFLLWLENQSLVQDIMDHVSKSIEYMVDGQWTVDMAKKLLKTWRHQSYQRVRMTGRNVGQPGDIFEVFVSIYVYKKPRSVFDNLEKSAVYNPPDWVNDPNQWDDAEFYDPKEGSPIVDLHVTIRGDKEGKGRPGGVMGDIYDLVGESDKDMGRKLTTPYEVAQYIKQKIDDYYRKWDNDNDDDDDPDDEPYDPAPASPQFNVMSGV